MSDPDNTISQNTNNNASGNNNRPRLKKIKRPVRRIQPQSQATPVSNSSQQKGFGKTVTNSGLNDDDFNLDTYLDEAENLPALSKRNTANEAPQFISDDEIIDTDLSENEAYYPAPGSYSTKTVILVAAGLFLLGFLLAKMFFNEQKVVNDGLQGVVVNAEVPRGRARCGTTDKTQGCVLYIMNPQRQELNARDFYDLASQLTGRQRFVIETGNMRYSSTKIRPGEFGQFNIPPLQ